MAVGVSLIKSFYDQKKPQGLSPVHVTLCSVLAISDLPIGTMASWNVTNTIENDLLDERDPKASRIGSEMPPETHEKAKKSRVTLAVVGTVAAVGLIVGLSVGLSLTRGLPTPPAGPYVNCRPQGEQTEGGCNEKG